MSSRPTVYITFVFGWGACVFGFCVGMIQPLGRQTSDTSTWHKTRSGRVVFHKVMALVVAAYLAGPGLAI
jgi:hypothetical protein